MIKSNIGGVYIANDLENLFILTGFTNSTNFPLALMCINSDSGEWMGVKKTLNNILISYD